jgi:hypothetical protein
MKLQLYAPLYLHGVDREKFTSLKNFTKIHILYIILELAEKRLYLHVKVLYFCHILTKLGYVNKFSYLSYIKFHENIFSCFSDVICGQTDRHIANLRSALFVTLAVTASKTNT